MEENLLVREFKAIVHATGAHFVVPIDIRRHFNWDDGDKVGLIVFGDDDVCKFHGCKILKSGPEVYGVDLTSLRAHEHIRVLAFELPINERRAKAPDSLR